MGGGRVALATVKAGIVASGSTGRWFPAWRQR
jgi:hypothetical protein